MTTWRGLYSVSEIQLPVDFTRKKKPHPDPTLQKNHIRIQPIEDHPLLELLTPKIIILLNRYWKISSILERFCGLKHGIGYDLFLESGSDLFPKYGSEP